MLSRQNNYLDCEKVVFYVKTKSFARDNRTKKEIDSFIKYGIAVEVVVFSDDETPEEYNGAVMIKFRGAKKSAPKDLFMRVFVSLRFSAFSLIYARKSAKNDERKTLHWVADPILFPLVLALKKFCRGDVVWDHHELPPEWMFHRKLPAFWFAKAYQVADFIVHANSSRMLYLEKKIKARALNAKIVNNYPRKDELQIEKSIPHLAKKAEGGFVFLQNSVSEARCGPSIFSALKRSGLQVIHAGEVTADQLGELESKVGSVGHFCTFAGSLELAEINWLLKRSLCTVICYKQTSANQIYCEPNRLFHAIGVGVRTIVGNNPTMVEEVADLPGAVVLADDGSDSNGIYSALEHLIASDASFSMNASDLLKTWDVCEGNMISVLLAEKAA